MIEATLECIAENGIQATTVRAVAARAGVSNGLIRHHFSSKEQLIVAAYRKTIAMMTEPARTVLESNEGTPRERLGRLVAATLDDGIADGRMLSLWATFISQVRVDPQIAAVHREGYLGFRRSIEPLIAEVLAAAGRPADGPECERLSTTINAVLDGLWLEGCMMGEELGEADRIELGLRGVEALLGVCLPRPAAKE